MPSESSSSSSSLGLTSSSSSSSSSLGLTSSSSSLGLTSSSSSSLSSSSSSSNSISSSSHSDDYLYENVMEFLSEPYLVEAGKTISIAALNKLWNSSSKGINVKSFTDGLIYIYVKGNSALCAQTVIMTFQISPDGNNWHDLQSITITLAGKKKIQDYTTVKAIDLAGVNFIRLARVQNTESTLGRNAYVSAMLCVR